MSEPTRRRLLDVAEAAERLNISKNHVYKLAADGVIAHRRLGRRVLIPEGVVDELCGEPSPHAS